MIRCTNGLFLMQGRREDYVSNIELFTLGNSMESDYIARNADASAREVLRVNASIEGCDLDTLASFTSPDAYFVTSWLLRFETYFTKGSVLVCSNNKALAMSPDFKVCVVVDVLPRAAEPDVLYSIPMNEIAKRAAIRYSQALLGIYHNMGLSDLTYEALFRALPNGTIEHALAEPL